MWALIIEQSGGLWKLLLVGSLTLTELDGLMRRITSADEKRRATNTSGLQLALSASAFFNPA